MLSASIAKIESYTESIVVDGKNKLTVKLTYEEAEGNYSSDLTIELGNKKDVTQIHTDNVLVFTSNFQIPVNWLSEIPDGDVDIGKITVRTYDMDKSSTEPINSVVRYFSVYVPEEFKPEISDLSLDILDIKSHKVDYAIYGLTFPRLTAVVTPHFTSPITRCRITGGGYDVLTDFTYNEDWENYNFIVNGPAITVWANTTFKLTVYDARGRSASITSEEIYVQPYNIPSINSLSAYRTDGDGIPQADGDHIKVIVDASISPIKDSSETDINTIYCLLEWQEVNGYGGFEEITNKEPYIFEANKDGNYSISCTVRDEYMETKAYCSVLGDNYDFNIAEGGGGAAIGMKAEEGYFDVAHESRFHKGISAAKVISSDEGLVSYGTGSKGDFLSFGEAKRIVTLRHTTPGSGTVVDEWGDFDEITSIGLYGVYYDSDVSSSNYYKVMNAPCEKAGTLRVFNSTGNIDEDSTECYLIQEYLVKDGSAIYRRCLSKSRPDEDTEWDYEWTFGSWYRYSGTKV